MTIEDIFIAIDEAQDKDKLDTAIAQLEKYDGPDKELITPDVHEYAIVSSGLAPQEN